ncbi:NUDIX hydrolase [Bacillus coahuilensis m2-6]|uniref:NUDIX hydrolase n=1 Tax=Bacillus coahuilensis p1.1.43 TaxID=1150625 RepID=A0A147K5J9_9BACI|nr:NUDIX domain-containing protein [Bacillus coahuilensis]KUP04513.1 NUDIX hydrolase [Bacillus coahuilensis m2-6]KUP04899.1 NUDIX hydrolase [Bacillus coahuilensis p1.1.43]
MYPIRVRACALVVEHDSVLLVKFEDEHGVHYNLPAGGVEKGESVKEAVAREAFEEAGIEVEVEGLAFVYEYAPHLVQDMYGSTPSLHMIFHCRRNQATEPILPPNPDPHQVAVEWVPLHQLHQILLFPHISTHIFENVQNQTKIQYIEEHQLKVKM